MSSMSEDIQCASSDTRPPMLDRTDFESWQQRTKLRVKRQHENVRQRRLKIRLLQGQDANNVSQENGAGLPPPPDYSKENLLATFTPQRNLTPEQIFWSIDDNDRKKAETSVPKPISALTVSEFCGKIIGQSDFWEMIISELSWVMEIYVIVTCDFCVILRELLKGVVSTNLYTISIDDMMKSSPICLLSKASKSKSWLWHRRLNHLNFGTINDLARKDLVRGVGIFHQKSIPRTPQQNGIVERRNRTLMEAARTMMIFSKAPMFLWAEVLFHRGTSLYSSIAQGGPSTSASSSTSNMHHPIQHQGIAEEPTLEDSPITHDVLHPLFNMFMGERFALSSSGMLIQRNQQSLINPTRSSQKMDQRSSSG
ncbi:integrase, catalytic region, zinc finger, CCHC-type containing protein [Tanacetum coccineum]|uniref:Integrase, catalytic region, zinc finger, CCHC-type containing protein n=1 Tax=Tanacetum coccineum TaxID=301880 RepID=A0ABQ5I3A3_9ASTR